MTDPRLRSSYTQRSLGFSDLEPDPIKQFDRWFADALAAAIPEPNAMTLATVGADGEPDARIVLLRGTDGGGFQFFTNYGSKKGRDLAAHPSAALILFWRELERQVRIKGRASRLDPARSQAYFATRPRQSQLAAWLSQQSEEAPVDSDFQAGMAALESRFAGGEVTLPPQWGGFHVEPSEIEFWQGRPNRLHDRFRYRRCADARWEIVRLYP